MKKILFIALVILTTVSVHAQYTKFNPDATSSEKSIKKAKKEKKSEKPKDSATATAERPAPVMKIDAKYGVGSCPVVNGKVEWSTTIVCPGLTAKQVYDKAIAFLVPYCKEQNKDELSQIALVNPSSYEIGARIGEWVEFSRSAFSLDRAMMHYTLCLYCFDGKCKVIIKSISFDYDNEKSPAEERLLDEVALNKTKTDFKKGGYKKFRTKTVDAKDTLFMKLDDAINHNPSTLTSKP